MRLEERCVKDVNRIVEILNECQTARVAFSEKNTPYMVPMCYGCEIFENTLTFYFHCADKGRKLDMMEKNNTVCVETDIQYGITSQADKAFACGYSGYASVIAFGKVSTVTDLKEKEKALKLLMSHYTGKDFSFNEKMLNSVTVIKAVCREFTAKQNLRT